MKENAMKTKRTHRQTGRNRQGKGTLSGYKAAAVTQDRPLPLVSSHIKPFTGKVFYLDLPSNKTTESLESAIKELGGTIEKFFSKEIKYLVSNKKEARYVNCLRQTSPVPSPDSGHSSSHPGSNLHKPCSHGDNVKDRSLNQTDTFVASRGKCLVDRVVNEQERVHMSKILSNALEWGVKILYVEDLMEYLRKKKAVGSQYPATVAVRKNIKAELATKQHLQKCKGGQISKPFVKVEDSSRHYRPIYISLPNMPQINLRSLPPSSPFLTKDKDSPGKKLHPHRGVKATPNKERAQNGQRRNRMKREGGYCECCMIKYESIRRHLLSDCHQAFSKGDKYSVLDKVISTMHFNFSTVLNQVKRSSWGVSSVPKQRHKEELHLVKVIASCNREEEDKSDEASTDGSRNKASGCKRVFRQNSSTCHTLKSSQAQGETAPPPGQDDPAVNVGTEQQEMPEEFIGNNLPENEEMSIPAQTFSPMRKIKRKVRIYKRKRQKVASHGCVKQNVVPEDSKLKLCEIFQSSDSMDVEFLGFKG